MIPDLCMSMDTKRISLFSFIITFTKNKMFLVETLFIKLAYSTYENMNILNIKKYRW